MNWKGNYSRDHRCKDLYYTIDTGPPRAILAPGAGRRPAPCHLRVIQIHTKVYLQVSCFLAPLVLWRPGQLAPLAPPSGRPCCQLNVGTHLCRDFDNTSISNRIFGMLFCSLWKNLVTRETSVILPILISRNPPYSVCLLMLIYWLMSSSELQTEHQGDVVKGAFGLDNLQSFSGGIFTRS